METFKEQYESVKLMLSTMKEDCGIYMKVSSILREYENFIKFLEEASSTSSYLQRNQIKDFVKNDTIRNLDEYKTDLQNKLKTLEDDNNRLLKAINECELKRGLLDEKRKAALIAIRVKHLQGKGCMGITEMALCKHLKIEPSQWAEKAFLFEKLAQLQINSSEIENSLRTWFIPRKKYELLFKSVLQKEKESGAHSMINKTLKTKVKRLKIGIEAAEISAFHGYRIPNNATQHISDVVDELINQFLVKQPKADQDNGGTDEEENIFLERLGYSAAQNTNFSNTDEDFSLQNRSRTIERPKSFDVKKSFTEDDPMKEQEAEMTMDYVEVFSQLFDEEKYEEAAFHAIYSPKGILRTQQTLQYFKNIENKMKKDEKLNKKNHLLNYCTLLMATVSVVGKDPTVWEVIESFKCAINESRFDLIEFWIAENKVFLPEGVANLLLRSCSCRRGKCCCDAVVLAEVVFRKLGCFHELVDVLLHQGRLATAVNCTYEGAPFSYIDYARILEDDTTCEKLSVLIAKKHKPCENRRIIVALVSSLNNEQAFKYTKACLELHEVLFSYKDFFEWEGSPYLCETFASLCRENGMPNEGEYFIASCMIWCALDQGQNVLYLSS